MNSIYWVLLLFLIPIAIVGGKVLSDIYAVVKARALSDIDETKIALKTYLDSLRNANLIFLQEYKREPLEPYRTCAQLFENTLRIAHDHIFASIETRRNICNKIPLTTEKLFLETFIAPIRMRRWFQASKELAGLWKSIGKHEYQIDLVNKALDRLYYLPVETSQQVKSTHASLMEAISILNELRSEGVQGESIKNTRRAAEDIEDDLNGIQSIFYTFSPDTLLNYPNIKKETQTAYQILSPTKTNVARLNKTTKEWKFTLKQLKSTLAMMQKITESARIKIAFLSKHLNLPGEKEELEFLSQEMLEIESNLKSITTEMLNSSLAKSKKTLGLLEDFIKSITVHEQNVTIRHTHLERNANNIKMIEEKMNAVEKRIECPVIWTSSHLEFGNLKTKLNKISSETKKLSTIELAQDISLLTDCNATAAKLLQKIDAVNTNLSQLAKLWKQITLTYTKEELSKVEDVFLQAKAFDMDSNWEIADNVKNFLLDATELWKRAKNSIPMSTSIPIYEQSIDSFLKSTYELVRVKPAFDQRRKNIQTRLKEVQDCEREAQFVHQRNYPPFVQIAKELQIADENSDITKETIAVQDIGLLCLQSLQQRDVGKVKDKLDAIRKWETEAIKNANAVCRFAENDILLYKKELTEKLEETKAYAEEFEEEVVVHAWEAAVIFEKHQFVVSGFASPAMEELQKHISRLLYQRRNTIIYYVELEKFLQPIRSEYKRLYEIFKEVSEAIKILRSEKNLGRKWPPVFRSLDEVNSRVNDFLQELREVWRRCRKKDRLLPEFDALRRDLKGIKNMVTKIGETDKEDVQSFLSLQEEYLKLTQKYAEQKCAGDIENMMAMYQAALRHVNEFLPRAYNGILKDGKVIKLTAEEVKSRLEDEVFEKHQQIINFNNVRARDIIVDQTLNQ